MRIAGAVVFSGALFTAAAFAQQPASPPPPQPVMQPAQHRCELSPDKRIVSLSVSNPAAQPTECTVSCYLPYKGGTATVTCTKVVDGNAVFTRLCAHGRDNDGAFTKLDRSSGQCSVAPAAPPPPTAALKPGEVIMRYKDHETMTQEEKLQDFTRSMGRKF
jgi:hypothetical protein